LLMWWTNFIIRR